MQRVLAAASEVLDGFRMEQLRMEDVEEDDLLESYVSTLRVEGKSQKTIDLYTYKLNRLQGFAKISWRRMTVHHMRAYLAKEQERGIKDSTLRNDRDIFCAFFSWLHKEGLIEKNPTANLGPIKCERVQKKAYSAIDIANLQRYCPNIRDLALINFLGATGCRISEALGLDRNSIDFVKLECTVRGKGKKERVVYLDPVAGQIVKQYLDGREYTEEDALFTNMKTGTRLTPNGARQALKRVAKKAGVTNVHPHRFRRTLATELTRHGMPVQEVAAILGHEKLDTTMKYVVLDHEMVKSSYNKYRG
jgi:site-specific recombinase XerD